jgi:hypothetical protein
VWIKVDDGAAFVITRPFVPSPNEEGRSVGVPLTRDQTTMGSHVLYGHTCYDDFESDRCGDWVRHPFIVE